MVRVKPCTQARIQLTALSLCLIGAAETMRWAPAVTFRGQLGSSAVFIDELHSERGKDTGTGVTGHACSQIKVSLEPSTLL